MAFTIKPLFKESTKYFALSSSFLSVGDTFQVAQVGYGTTLSKEGVVRGIAICSEDALTYTEKVDTFIAEFTATNNAAPSVDEIRAATKGVKQGKFIWFSSTVFNKYDLDPTSRSKTTEEEENGIMHKGTLCDILRKFVEDHAENGVFEASNLDQLSTELSGGKVKVGRDFKYRNDRGYSVTFLKYDFEK